MQPSEVAEKQIDQLQTFFYAFVLTTIVVITSAGDEKATVSFFGIEMEKSGAFNLASGAYILTVLIMAQMFLRLSDILRSADHHQAPKVLATLFTHPWPFNPFAYFGSGRVSALHSSFGFGMLVFVWWLGLLSLGFLWRQMGPAPRTPEHVLWDAYIVAGLVSLAAIVTVYRSISSRLAEFADGMVDQPTVGHDVYRTLVTKCGIALVFAALGILLFIAFSVAIF